MQKLKKLIIKTNTYKPPQAIAIKYFKKKKKKLKINNLNKKNLYYNINKHLQTKHFLYYNK
jgi:hypothetical protein